MTAGLAGVARSLHEHGALALGGLHGQLIKGEDFTASLQDASAGSLRYLEGAHAQLGHLVDAQVVGHGADNNGNESFAAGFLHEADHASERRHRPVNAAHEEASQHDLVELGVGPARQETVDLNQEAEVDILALGPRPADLAVVLVAYIDTLLFLQKRIINAAVYKRNGTLFSFVLSSLSISPRSAATVTTSWPSICKTTASSGSCLA